MTRDGPRFGTQEWLDLACRRIIAVARVNDAGGGVDGNDDDVKDADGRNGSTVTERRTQTKTKKPSMYKVILLNDDYTPMEFVVELLKVVFHKPHAEATRIMLHVHQNGMGVAGVYPFEIAETKVRPWTNWRARISFRLSARWKRNEAPPPLSE